MMEETYRAECVLNSNKRTGWNNHTGEKMTYILINVHLQWFFIIIIKLKIIFVLIGLI